MARPVTIRLQKYGAEGIYNRIHTAVYKEMLRLFNKGVSPSHAHNIVSIVTKEVVKSIYYPGKY